MAIRLVAILLVMWTCCSIASGQTTDGPMSVEQATVYIECSVGSQKSKGTGVIVSSDGLVLTAKHVVLPDSHCAGEIGRPSPNPTFLLTPDAHQWTGWDIIALRLVKETGRSFTFVRYHRINSETKSKPILARGIKDGGTEIAVSQGIISTGQIDSRGLLDTDALASSGMSGGPVVLSADGALVGIVAGADCAPSSYGIFAVQLVASDLGLVENPALALPEAQHEHCKPDACHVYDAALRLGIEAKLYRVADQITSLNENAGLRPSKDNLLNLANTLGLGVDIEKLTSEKSATPTSNVEAILRGRLQTLFPAGVVNLFDVGIRIGGAVGSGLTAPKIPRSTAASQKAAAVQRWNDDLTIINNTISRFGISKLELSISNANEADLTTVACSAAGSLSKYFVDKPSECGATFEKYKKLVGNLTIKNNAPTHDGNRINGKRLIYFKKASDLGIVQNTLTKNKLYYEEQNGTNDQATNVVSCQPSDDINQIKWLAKTLIEAGVRLQGIAPQARRTNLIGIEHYPEYARMPMLNEYLLSTIKSCPLWIADELPSQYISAVNNCPREIYGTITYKEPVPEI